MATLVYICNLCIITLGILTQTLGNYCNLSGGKKGQCVNAETCFSVVQQELQQQECENSTICCQVLDYIVTPQLKCQRNCLQYYSVSQRYRRRWDYFNKINRFPKFTSSVVGGEKASPKEFPHMAGLGFGDDNSIQWQCGGSLISDKFILTAAHCVSTSEIGKLKRIRLGSLNLQNTTNEQNIQEIGIAQIFRHPEYARPTLYNDIALIELERSIVITEYVRPACLTITDYVPNNNLIATGWGRTQYFGPRSDTLMKVSLELFSQSQCNRAYNSISPRQLPNGIIEELQICAGDADEGKDACQGDSGGPLQIEAVDNPGLYYIIGITSFGRGCGTSSNPGVYTKVSNYVSWIESVVWPNE